MFKIRTILFVMLSLVSGASFAKCTVKPKDLEQFIDLKYKEASKLTKSYDCIPKIYAVQKKDSEEYYNLNQVDEAEWGTDSLLFILKEHTQGSKVLYVRLHICASGKKICKLKDAGY